MKRKVLFVVDEKKLGGVNVVLENLLNNLNLNKLDVTLLILHNTGTALNNLNSNINVIYGTKAFEVIDQDFKYLIKSKSYIKAIKKLILSLKIKNGSIKSFILKQREKMNLDKFDVEVAFKAGFCSLFVAYSDANKKINWVHEDYKTYNKTKRYENTFKSVFEAFNKHVVVSSDAAKSFNNIYHQEVKTVVIENYINEENLKNIYKDNNNSTVELDKIKTNIVTLGRFCYEKGFDRLIEAINSLRDKVDITKIKVNILGYGELEETLNEQIKQLKLENVIEIYNTQKLKINTYAFLKEHDLFIMPSRSESFGMTRIEALILGVPVLTTNVANSDKLIHKNYGIIVENTTEDLAQGILSLIQDKDKLKELKQNVKDYSYSKENKRIIDQVQTLLEEKSETKE